MEGIHQMIVTNTEMQKALDELDSVKAREQQLRNALLNDGMSEDDVLAHSEYQWVNARKQEAESAVVMRLKDAWQAGYRLRKEGGD